MTIFDFINKTEFQKMLENLSKYKIDDYYNKNFKGKQEILSIINNELSKLNNYSRYKKEMLNLLIGYYKDSKDIEVIFYEEYNQIRINSIKCSYPVFCLEMVRKEDRIK